MSGWLSLAALYAVVATVVAVCASLLVAASWRWLEPRLERAAMAGRTALLSTVAGFPLLCGGAVCAACMGPSLVEKLGLAGDHCLVHLDHALHLCMRHLPSAAPTFTIGAIVALGAGIALSAAWRAAKLVAAGRSQAQALDAIAHERDGVHWISSAWPLALTAGVWRPKVYVSSGLRSGLAPNELRAAIAHERCHARERHALRKLLAAIMATFHLPGPRRELGSLLDLACERRADEAAAIAVNDRLQVASALVRAHRLAREDALCLSFSSGPRQRLDQRVRALLAAAASEPKRAWASWALSAVLAAAAVANHELHHAVEHMLELLV